MENDAIPLAEFFSMSQDNVMRRFDAYLTHLDADNKGVAMSEFDNVNRPKHYADGKVECIDAMEQVFGIEAVKYFCLLNSFKYHWRHSQKNGDEDIKKATWYMDKYHELLNRGD